MSVNDPRKLDTGCKQKRPPVDCVLSQNILPDQVHRRPILIQAGPLVISVPERRYVIGKSVQPDVHHMIFIARNRYAPRDRAFFPADRKVLKAPFYERYDFIAASIGPYPCWI